MRGYIIASSKKCMATPAVNSVNTPLNSFLVNSEDIKHANNNDPAGLWIGIIKAVASESPEIDITTGYRKTFASGSMEPRSRILLRFIDRDSENTRAEVI